MQKVQAYDDDLRSESGAPEVDDLDNDTDTLGRAILRHERDARRIQSLLGSSQPNDAGHTSRLALSSRSRRGNQQTKESENYTVDEDGGRSSFEVEPGLNVPRAWGRKIRSGRDWTRTSRIPISSQVPERTMVVGDAEVVKPSVAMHTNSYTDWEARHVELHVSLEDTPPSMRRRRPFTQPTSLRTMNPRLREIVRATKDDDLSLPPSIHKAVSTVPAVGKQQAPAIDSIEGIPSRRPRTEPREKVQKPQYGYNLDASSDKENIAQPASSVSALQPLQLSSTADDALARHDQSKSSHSRGESRPIVKPTAQVPGLPQHGAGIHTDSRVAQHESSNEPPLEPPTPMVTGGWIDSPKIDKLVQSLPDTHDIQPASNMTDLKDIISSTVFPSAPSIVAHQHEQKDIRPALAEIRQATMQKGLCKPKDSVPPSLQNTASVNQAAVPSLEAEDGAKANTEDYVTVDRRDIPSGHKTERSKESKLAALSKHISEAVSSPKDVAVVQAPEQQVETFTSVPKPTTLRRATLNSNGKTVCDHCGGSYTSVWRGLWTEFRSNFWFRDPEALFTIRFTRLGAFIFTWICWYILESMLCLQYCQPQYAVKMVGYGVDPYAPEFPFVIPTLLFRPFGFAWRPTLKWLSWAANIALNWIIGIEPQVKKFPSYAPRPVSESTRHAYGTIRQPAKWVETAATVTVASTRRAVASAIDAVDEIGRLW